VKSLRTAPTSAATPAGTRRRASTAALDRVLPDEGHEIATTRGSDIRDLLEDATDQAFPVKIAYMSSGGELTTRVIEPIEVDSE
jgi:predicted DNA-binding transcriptional regulator YafY